MNYLFKIGVGLDNISFDAKESDVIKLLGKPNKIERDSYIDEKQGFNDETIYYSYDNLGIFIKFNYFDNEYYGLTINTNKLIFNNQNWFLLTKRKIINIIKEVYREKDLSYTFEKEKLNVYGCEVEKYEFETIGLTIWFENNKIDDLYINKPVILSASTSQQKAYTIPEPNTESIAAEPEIAYKKKTKD